MRNRSAALFAAVFGPNGLQRDEWLVLIGLLLLARGLWLAWPPSAYMVAGALLIWIALPSRSAFVIRPEKADRKAGRRPR